VNKTKQNSANKFALLFTILFLSWFSSSVNAGSFDFQLISKESTNIFDLNWTQILEQIISGVVVLTIAAIITFIGKKVLVKKKSSEKSVETNKNQEESILKNPFLISLFITSTAAVLSFFALIYYSGITIVFVCLLFATAVLAIISYGIYDNQCPNCNRIFSKQIVNTKVEKKEKKPYRHRKETIYLYSDGTEKDRRFTGKEKTRMETLITEREFYKCEKCGHEWNRLLKRNLDKENRPEPEYVTTRFKPPGYN